MGLKTSLYRLRRRKLFKKNQSEELLSEEDVSDLWKQCPDCKEMVYHTDMEDNMSVCPHCGYHFRVSAYERIEQLIDAGTWNELFHEITTSDPLEFVDLKRYKHRLESAKKVSESSEAIITGHGKVLGEEMALGVMEFKFLGGSMGSVVGERIKCLAEYAVENKIPLMLVSASGGARMHEGLVSLFQMAKTSAALNKLKDEKLLFISLLTDPTYGGVSASFSMLGDIIMAEPKARIGFAGPRVIEETIKQKLPKDFQSSEYLLEHGQIDLITPRKELKQQVNTLIKLHK